MGETLHAIVERREGSNWSTVAQWEFGKAYVLSAALYDAGREAPWCDRWPEELGPDAYVLNRDGVADTGLQCFEASQLPRPTTELGELYSAMVVGLTLLGGVRVLFYRC